MNKKIIRQRPRNVFSEPLKQGVEDIFGNFWSPSNFFRDSFWDDRGSFFSASPAVDLREETDKFIVEIDLPGYDTSDIQVEIEDNSLVISASRKNESKMRDSKYLRQERQRGSFFQKISLPEGADLDQAECETHSGVLSISVPKKKSAKKKVLQIKTK